MIIWLLFLLAGIVADTVAGIYDKNQTKRGIAKGVAVEGNPLIRLGLPAGVYNILLTSALAVVGAVGLVFGMWALAGGGIGALFASAGKHVIAGKNWEYLLKGGSPRPKQTAFQKFVGLLSWNEGE